MVRQAFECAVLNKWVSPAEFWNLHPDDFWWIYEAHNPQTQDDFWDDLYNMLGAS